MKSLSLIVGAAMIAIQGYAYSVYSVDGYMWRYDDYDGGGRGYICGVDVGGDDYWEWKPAVYRQDGQEVTGHLTVPEVINGTQIVFIENHSFYELSKITGVTIPDAVTFIGYSAFEGCSSIGSMTLPDCVKSIGSSAFEGCSSMASINIPDGAISIPDRAFFGCSSLKQITIPKNVRSIGAHAFDGCTALTTVNLLSDNLTIGEGAFRGCSKLVKNGMLIIGGVLAEVTDACTGNVQVPDGITMIADGAFAKMESYWDGWDGEHMAYRYVERPGITSIQLPSTVRHIGASAFRGCSGLTNISIPNSVTNIGNYAFSGCSGLTSVSVPNSVVNIGEYAFRGCAKLPEITLSAGLKRMGICALSACPLLKKVAMPPDVWCTGSLSGFSYALQKDLDKLGYFAQWIVDVHWDNGSHDYVVSYSPVEDVTLVAGGEELYSQMFKSASMLKQVVLSENITKIGSSAFEGCSGISSISLPSELTSIGSSAFFGCGNLAEVVIPSSVTSIGDGAFCGCNKLADQNGFIVFNNFLHGYAGAESEVEIPENITGIGLSAFQNCTDLKTITIPPNVLSIGYNAFSGCTQLTKVYVSAGDTERVKGLMANCGRSLAAMTFIEQTVFTVTFDLGEHGQRTGGGELSQKIAGGQAAVAPTVLVSKDWQFDGWDKDFSCVNADMTVKARYLWDFVIANGRLTKYRGPGGAIVIPDGVTSIEDSVFEGLGTLTSVTIPDTVTSIGEKAFYNCGSLSEFTLPESVTFIGAQAFDNSPFYLKAYRKMLMGGKEESGSGAGAQMVSVTVTNVVVNYVLNSAQPQFVLPATYDTGFVNIIAEVKGGCVAVPATWTVNYPKFTEKFGSDFTKALAMQTGKMDGAGNPMFVWQDYVAGTDPTKEDDVFTASIMIVDGKVKVSYSPELDDARKALRKYTTWGKVKLTDKDWSVVGEGEEDNFSFFKVTVEMR